MPPFRKKQPIFAALQKNEEQLKQTTRTFFNEKQAT